MSPKIFLNRNFGHLSLFQTAISKAAALISLILLAIIWGFALYEIERDAKENEQQTLANLSSLAHLFEEHVIRTVSGIDSALLYLREAYENRRDTFTEQVDNVENRIFKDVVFQISIITESGRLLYSNLDPASKPIDLSDREHFRIHKENQDKDLLFISKPVQGKLSGKWSIQFTRRLQDADGNFDGVIVLSVNPDYFVHIYRSIDLGANGGITLVGMDRVIRVRIIGSQKVNSALGQELPENRDYFNPAKPSSGITRFLGVVDNTQRLASYRRLGNYPLVVVVHQAEEEIAQKHTSRLVLLLTLAVISSLVVIVCGIMLIKQNSRQHRRHNELISAYNALAKSENKYRSVVEAMSEGLILQNEEGKIIEANLAAEKILGLSQKQLMSDWQAIKEDGSPYNGREHPAILTLEDGIARHEQIMGIKKPETEKTTWISINTQPLFGTASLNPYAVLSSFTDITAKREAQTEILRSNSDLEHFSYAISHDLQQPLRIISNFSQLLAKRYQGKLDPEADEFIAYIVGSARKMSKMITDLLEYSRIHSRGEKFQTVDLNQSLRDALNNLSLALEESGGHVDVPSKLPQVWGDPSQLMRLFQNLVGNALKYRRPDIAPLVVISALPKGGYWQIHVKDNGIGIDPEMTGRLFKVFSRLHSEDEYAGSGVGLAIARRIVERHGGEIGVIAQGKGKGADFYFSLSEDRE